MHRRSVSSPLFRCALGIVFLALFGSASSASVIYEYRESGSTAVIGTLTIMEPPASIANGWSTEDSSDLVSFFLDGFGPEDVLLAGVDLNVGISSFDGSKLDSGGLGITFPTIFPSNPADPIIDRSLSVFFDVPAGGDFIGLATVDTFPDGSVIIGDLLLDGDWTAVDAAVPEPGTFALLGMGLLAAGRSAMRRRAKRSVECRVSRLS